MLEPRFKRYRLFIPLRLFIFSTLAYFYISKRVFIWELDSQTHESWYSVMLKASRARFDGTVQERPNSRNDGTLRCAFFLITSPKPTKCF